MKIYILNIVLISILALSIFNNKFKNMLIAPIEHLFVNLKNGNFGNDTLMKDKGIKIELQKHKWSYSIKKNADELRVNFYSSILQNKNEDYRADLTIFDSNTSNDLFMKIVDVNIRECDKVATRKDKKNNHLIYRTVCSYDKLGIIYWHIPSKRMIVSFYPYIENPKNQEKVKNFIDGIKIID